MTCSCCIQPEASNMSARTLKRRTRPSSALSESMGYERMTGTKRLRPAPPPMKSIDQGLKHHAAGILPKRTFTSGQASSTICPPLVAHQDVYFTFTQSLSREIRSIAETTPSQRPLDEAPRANTVDEDLEDILLNDPSSGKVSPHG